MISACDILHLPCTSDLIQGGIAYALRSLPYNFQHGGSSIYERLRHAAAEGAVELAFRRSLSEQNIPFDVKAALPIADPRLEMRPTEVAELLGVSRSKAYELIAARIETGTQSYRLRTSTTTTRRKR